MRPLLALRTSFPSLRRWEAWRLLAPALLFLVALSGYPLVTTIRLSFSEGDRFIGLDNYAWAFSDPALPQIVVQTLTFVGVSVVAHLVLGLFIALLLHQPMNSLLKAIFRSVIMLPWAITPIVVATIWRLMYDPARSFIPPTLSQLGLRVVWMPLASIDWALLAVTLVNVWFSLPFYMLVILAGLQAVPEELLDAATVDGAGWLQRLRYVILPHLRNLLVTLAIFDFIGAFVFFDLVWVMTQGGPINRTEVLSTLVYRTAFRGSLNTELAATLAVVMMLIELAGVGALMLTLRREE